jgi:NodT family efflux transporter outer membrane factor (OMF) lipoprotein
MKRSAKVAIPLGLLLLALSGCMVGPNYKRPEAPVPPAFKEPPPASFAEAEAAPWKESRPGDAYAKGRWWEVFGDPALDALEEQVSLQNQNVQQAEAQYRQAKAAVGVARSALFPTLTTAPSVTVAGPRNGAATTTDNAGTASRGTIYDLPVSVGWEPDLWGSVRRGVRASAATADSLGAILENARLLYQAELAQDYFGLHGLDAQADLLTRTAASYEEFLALTRARFSAGVASDLDVAEAESQLYDVQSQLIDLEVQRAAFEHAIAILIGKAPADLTLPRVPLTTAPPPLPVGLPSELLERRPDIASAERQVAAANEQIGIAIAAFYPNLTLTGSAGFSSSTLAKWLTWPSRFWSVGPQLAATLFDAGRRRRVVAGQRAAYDATVAGYRQTVLVALQQVEDNLAALRVLAAEADKAEQTVRAAQRALDISAAQYKAGTTSYLPVVTSQATLLSANVRAVTVLTRRLTASVLLIEGLGGGWNTPPQKAGRDVAATRP